MTKTRRQFLGSTATLAGGVSLASWVTTAATQSAPNDERIREASFTPRSFTVIPIVGDGKWIWTEPPSDGKTGYLEPREFDVTVGIEARGQGNAIDFRATTVAPLEFPEQKIKDLKIETHGSHAQIVKLTDSAAQLAMSVLQISKDQVVSATARYRLVLYKDYRGYRPEDFPKDQNPKTFAGQSKRPASIPIFSKEYLGSSPGINIRSSVLTRLHRSMVSSKLHPWEQARKFYEWVWENIKGIPGRYTSVETAIQKGRGDCEERAAVFIALCRLSGIPARLVWIPSHNWAEIGLFDHAGKKHWVPIHTAAYSWFGWTGAHEVVLQKGDKVRLAHRRSTMRLIDDWYRCRGRMPTTRFTSTVTPVSSDNQDAGPGARTKLADGRWELSGQHVEGSSVRPS